MVEGTVRKGEHGTQIICYKQLPEHAKKDENTTGEDERVPFVLCHYTVFNVEQCDDLTLPQIEQPTTAPEIDEDELCESIVMLPTTTARCFTNWYIMPISA
jgi:antirestriction protein ArdC